MNKFIPKSMQETSDDSDDPLSSSCSDLASLESLDINDDELLDAWEQLGDVFT